MKKILALGLLVAFAAASFAYACGDDKTSGTASASCCAKKSGDMAATNGVEAKMVSEKTACTGNMANCPAGAKCDEMIMSSYVKETGYKGKLAVVNMSISGMHCTHCSDGVTAGLGKVDGVLKVVSVDYKTGDAKVLVAADKAKNENLIKAVADSKFAAKIVVADAKMDKTDKAEMKNDAATSAH